MNAIVAIWSAATVTSAPLAMLNTNAAMLIESQLAAAWCGAGLVDCVGVGAAVADALCVLLGDARMDVLAECVRGGVAVPVGDTVGAELTVAVGVCVGVCVLLAVWLGVLLPVCVPLAVWVLVCVDVIVPVPVPVGVCVCVIVAVPVPVGVCVGVSVPVAVGDCVAMLVVDGVFDAL